MTTTNPNADLIARYRQAQDAMGGCTDGYCVVRRNKGQRTNGGCRCMYHPDHIATQRAGHIMRLAQDMADALAALDVNETAFREHQRGLMLTDGTQADMTECAAFSAGYEAGERDGRVGTIQPAPEPSRRGAIKLPTDPVEAAITPIQLADTFDAVWNAAIGESIRRQEGIAFAAILAESFAAMSRTLRALAGEGGE